jgi:hypothetical protein
VHGHRHCGHDELLLLALIIAMESGRWSSDPPPPSEVAKMRGMCGSAGLDASGGVTESHPRALVSAGDTGTIGRNAETKTPLRL